MLRPYLFADRLCDVELRRLKDAGFLGLIVDLDNTLLPYGQAQISVESRDWISAAKALDFRIVILSNNFPERVAMVASMLGVPAIANALKPLPLGFLRAMRILKVPRSKTLIIGDQLMTDILGAATVGIRGILTIPIVNRDFPLTRVLRKIEKIVLRLSGGRSA